MVVYCPLPVGGLYLLVVHVLIVLSKSILLALFEYDIPLHSLNHILFTFHYHSWRKMNAQIIWNRAFKMCLLYRRIWNLSLHVPEIFGGADGFLDTFNPWFNILVLLSIEYFLDWSTNNDGADKQIKDKLPLFRDQSNFPIFEFYGRYFYKISSPHNHTINTTGVGLGR